MTAAKQRAAPWLLCILLLTVPGAETALGQEAIVAPLGAEVELALRLAEAEILLQPGHYLLPQELEALRALAAEAEAYPQLAAASRSLVLLAREKLYAQRQVAAGQEPAARVLEQLGRESRQAGRLRVRKTLFWTFLGSGVGFLVLSNLAAYVPDIADRAVTGGSSWTVGFWWNVEDLVAEYRVHQVSAGLSILCFALSAILLAGGTVQ